jgi:hypothetical protein
MKNWFLIAVLALLPLVSISGNEEWIKHSETLDFIVFTKRVACDDEYNGLFQDKVLIRIENKRANAVKISWDLGTWYDGKEWGYGDHRFEVIVPAKGNLDGDCQSRELSVFAEFRNHSDLPKLTDFALENVVVTNLK